MQQAHKLYLTITYRVLLRREDIIIYELFMKYLAKLRPLIINVLMHLFVNLRRTLFWKEFAVA